LRTSIVFILPSYAGGGAERVIITLLNSLDRKKFKPILIVLNCQGPLKTLVKDDINVVNLNIERLRWSIFRLIVVLRNIKPCAIVSTFGYINVALLASRPFLLNSPKIIIREANTPSKSLVSANWTGLVRFMYRKFYPKADAVICNADIVASELISQFKLPKAKVFRLNNPIDIEMIRDLAQKPPGSKKEGLRFVAAGRLCYQKGFDRLIEDFSRTPINYQLTILGRGSDEVFLKKKIIKNGIENRVKIKNFETEPWAEYSNADAFLLSSRWEGMSNAALESLACGTPVIATPESGGIAELIACNNSPVTLASSGDDFLKAILEVSENSYRRPRPSLLPEAWSLSQVAIKFEDLLVSITTKS